MLLDREFQKKGASIDVLPSKNQALAQYMVRVKKKVIYCNVITNTIQYVVKKLWCWYEVATQLLWWSYEV